MNAPNIIYMAECRFTDGLPADAIIKAAVEFAVEVCVVLVSSAIRVDLRGERTQPVKPIVLLCLIPVSALVRGMGVGMSEARCTALQWGANEMHLFPQLCHTELLKAIPIAPLLGFMGVKYVTTTPLHG